MDDDIEIEEHDILEHPDVKAVFPDLANIQIQVHTAGDEFLEDSSCIEVAGSLLAERHVSDNNFDESLGVAENEGLEESSNTDVVHKLFEDTYEYILNQEIGAHEGSDVENDAPRHDYIQESSDVEFIEDTQPIADNKDENESSDVELVSEYYIESILPDQTIPNEFDEIDETDKVHNTDNNEVPTENEFTEVQNTNDECIGNEGLNNYSIENSQDIDVENVIDNCERRNSLVSEEFADNQSEMTQDESQYDGNQAIRDTKQWVLNQNSGYLNMELPDYQCEVPVKQEVEEYLESTPEDCSNELPPEDIYHYNNKIILGSKPSQQTSRSKISHLAVVLDDWSVHLNRSNSYCRTCQTLFSTPNALDVHKMVAHSFLTPLTNRAVKSTAKSSANVARKKTTNNLAKKSTSSAQSTYCNHCDVTFGDHTALISHLYELLPAKKYTCKFCEETFGEEEDLINHNSLHMKVEKRVTRAKANDKNPILRNLLTKKIEMPAVKIREEIVEKASDSYMYKCTICGEIFRLYSQTRAHRINAHPGEKNKILFKRLRLSNSKEKLKYEEDMKKVKLIKKSNVKIEFEGFELIPKSTLFKCPKCSVYFLSCYSGMRHCMERCGTANVRNCTVCKRKLRGQEMELHRKQHLLSSKFKVYTITKDICSRTLCKCLKCNLHFRTLTLKLHVDNCGRIPTAKCKKCNLVMPSKTLVTHANIHRTLQMKPKDFIIVDYVVKGKTAKKIKEQPISKPDTDITIDDNEDKEAVKNESQDKDTMKDKLKLYFCEHCKCYVRRNLRKSIQMHSNKRCRKQGLGSICSQCGLRLPYKLLLPHLKIHALANFTLKDFELFDFKTQRPIVPKIPNYPHCRKCDIHFISHKLMRKHICGEDYEDCDVCGDKFEVTALKVHRPFHFLKTKSEAKMIPELMKKYESLNAIWNVLFVCDKCDLVTDLYNRAVEHSQAHLKKANVQTNTIKCYICNLKFDESCWAKHSALHSRMALHNKDFKLLKYSPKNLLDESWFRMFESLPEKDIRQIIDRSVFGSERSLKMRLVKDGLPEFTVYCCSECQVSYDNNGILGHVRGPCRPAGHVCKTCAIAFANPSTLQFHEQLHKKGIKKEEFRIVNFEKNSGDVQETVKSSGSRVRYETTVNTKMPDAKVGSTKNPKFHLYKCRACSACLTWRRSIAIHKCVPQNKLYRCEICKQNILATRVYHIHKQRHRENPSFTAKNIKIINFVPSGSNLERGSSAKATDSSSLKPSKAGSVAKRLNKTTIPKSSLKHKTSKANKSSTELGTSSALKTAHSFESLVNLMTRDNPKPKERTTLNSSKHKNDLNVESSPKTAKVYKCDCGLHYTSMRAIESHMQSCDDADYISKENCSKCGLLFPTDVLVSHLCKHHSRDTQLLIEEVHKKPIKPTEVDQTRDYEKLYKCGDCNVYFLNQNSCYKHISKHEPLDPKQYIECKMCSLQFRILSLHVHIKKHHEKEFNLQKVLVEEYRPTVGKQAPKIDMYFASEKLQNVQVSSSND